MLLISHMRIQNICAAQQLYVFRIHFKLFGIIVRCHMGQRSAKDLIRDTATGIHDHMVTRVLASHSRIQKEIAFLLNTIGFFIVPA